ncbi:16418_t:CDS:2, partial [Funneliformis geosporum]
SASRQYQFREKLAKAGVDPEIINNYAKDPDLIRKSNKIQKERQKLAQIFGLDEQNAKVYNMLFGENMALKKQLEDYHSQPNANTLERSVKRLEKDVRSLKDELKDLDECVDRET